MKPVTLQAILVSLVVLVSAGGLTLGFGNSLFRIFAAPDPNSTKSAEISSARVHNVDPPASSPVPGSSIPIATDPVTGKRPPALAAPAFDIVRVEPDGNAVVAGRAAPGASVELLHGNEVLGHEIADAAGEFVIISPRLPQGRYELRLRATREDGKQVLSDRGVDVAIEVRKQSAVAAKPTSTKMPSLVRAPSKDTTASAIQAVVADDEGKLAIKGRARAGSPIKVYLNGTLIASATPGADQQFSVTINQGVGPGTYRVRLEQVDPASGSVLARSELSFDVSPGRQLAALPVQTKAVTEPEKPDARPPEASTESSTLPVMGASSSHVVVPKIETATVTRGDSLWRISRHSYGSGDLYLLILRANRAKIRNPNLIYPSQILVLPPR